MPLKVDRSLLGSGVEVFKLAGSLTLGRDAQNLESAVEELASASAPRVVFDLAEVSFVDSAGVGILVGSHGKIVSAGGKLHIAAPTARVLNVLKISKVDKVLSIDDSVAAALAALGA